jgi:hypothetical protein
LVEGVLLFFDLHASVIVGKYSRGRTRTD